MVGEAAGEAARGVKANRFQHFAAIDWSGAAGERQKGIAIALCGAEGGPPRLLRNGKAWSREDVLACLLDDLPDDTLVGFDLGMSLPFLDAGAFFPDGEGSPPDARSRWTLVEVLCAADPHLSASSFVEHPELCRYFRRHGGREGDRFHGAGASHRRGRFRATEQAQERLGCKPYSNFNLVGAAQVGKSSLTGMRLLHRLSGLIPIWPVDPLPGSGSAIVEIYTTIAALAASRTAARSKMQSYAALNEALGRLGSPQVTASGEIDDHSADALLTSAWLRLSAHRAELWRPAGLSSEIARTEGWTFGAV
jgi:hypothetical protein